ncbi:MAG: TCR/Tet family MFS transporter [Proteobacteria bacterium]|nr:TCR/Tet family MFS transporter [Pseudomonadota bacterium]
MAADARRARPAAIVFIFVTVVLDVLAMGIIIPVLPALVREFLGGDTAKAAEVFGVFGTTWAAMQFVCAPIIGVLSDMFGRRKVILLSNFGLGLDYIVMAVAPTLPWLFLGRVVSGITGASWTTAGAYIADVSPPEKRAQGFGILGAAFGLGFVLGPALGGVLGSIDIRLPFWAAAALTLVNAMYGVFVLPESLPPEKRRPFEWRRANPLGSLKLLRSHHELWGLAGVNFLYNLAHQSLQSVFVLYGAYRYAWGERTVGLTLAGVGVGSMIVQGGLVRPIVTALGERRSLLLGLTCGVVAMTGWGLAPTGGWFWAVIPFGAFFGLYGPSAQGLMTKRVQQNEYGQLQGANSSIIGIAGLLGPGLFTYTFAKSIGARSSWHVPGAPFLLSAVLLACAFVLALRVTGRREVA